MTTTPHPAKGPRRRQTCKSCFGSGRIDDHESPVRRCDDCVGKGYYYANRTVPAKGRTKATPKAHLLPDWEDANGNRFPCAVIPSDTQRQALAAVRFANLSEDQKAEKLSAIVLRKSWPKWQRLERARAVLQLLTGGGKGGAR